MDKLKLLTIIVIVVLLVLTTLTLCMIVKNANLIKETFVESNHNCYPYTSVLNARLSFNSPSKGWCTTGDYDDLDEGEDDYSDSKKSSACGPSGKYHRISGKESMKLDSKAWCKSA